LKKNILILFLAVIVACDYPIFDSKKATEPKVAITSFFCPDSVIRVKVAPVTYAFTDSSATLEIKEVKLTDQKTGRVVYLEKEEGSASIFTSNQLVPTYGDVLKIEAVTGASEESISAVDSISSTILPFRLVDIGVTVDDRSSGNSISCDIYHTGTVKFLPEGDIKTHYYELIIFISEQSKEEMFSSEPNQVILRSNTSFVTSEDYYPSKTSIQAYYPKSLLFKITDESKDSVLLDYTYGNSSFFTSNRMNSIAHDLRVELRTVSYSYYNYKTSRYKQRNSIIGDIIYGAAQPVMVPSNVENGTGIFAGYNVTAIDTFIDEYVYQRKKN
jgi:hypothetical protein